MAGYYGSMVPQQAPAQQPQPGAQPGLGQPLDLSRLRTLLSAGGMMPGHAAAAPLPPVPQMADTPLPTQSQTGTQPNGGRNSQGGGPISNFIKSLLMGG